MQKFHRGDLVRIAKDLGPSMSHFTADCDAIVVGSYADRFGGNDHENYTLHLRGRGQVSWYYGSQLTMIEPGRVDTLKEWEDELEVARRQRSDIDWIFAHGEEVMKEEYGASIQALANCFGMTNLWGSHGEGIAYYRNATATVAMAEPYLRSGDKAGWLARCEAFKRVLAERSTSPPA